MHGNASLDRVTYNALSILTAIGRTDVPVYAGARKPFMRPAVHAPDIHGESGIDGTTLLPKPTVSHRPGNAIVAMRDAIMATPMHTSVLVATGTLTNVALLLATFPEVAAHLRELSLMGGAFASRADAKGNITPCAEFNIHGDPEAAYSLLSNPQLGGRITVVPLDLTHKVLATPDVLARLRGDPGPGSTLRTMLCELLTYFSATYARVFSITAGPPLHDPLAVAVVLPTDEIAWQMDRARIHVVCHGEQVGMTTANRAPEPAPEPASPEPAAAATTAVPRVGLGGGVHPQDVYAMVKVPQAVDVDAFWNVLLGLVAQADGRYSWPAERAE